MRSSTERERNHKNKTKQNPKKKKPYSGAEDYNGMKKNARRTSTAGFNDTEERICELENRSFVIIQSEENKEKKKEKQ